MTCVWHVDGQCCMTSDQDRLAAGIAPSCASVADPENDNVSPTRHVVPSTGARSSGSGPSLPVSGGP